MMRLFFLETGKESVLLSYGGTITIPTRKPLSYKDIKSDERGPRICSGSYSSTCQRFRFMWHTPVHGSVWILRSPTHSPTTYWIDSVVKWKAKQIVKLSKCTGTRYVILYCKMSRFCALQTDNMLVSILIHYIICLNSRYNTQKTKNSLRLSLLVSVFLNLHCIITQICFTLLTFY